MVEALNLINITYNEADRSLSDNDDFNPYINYNITIKSHNDDVEGQFVLFDENEDIKVEDYNIAHSSIFNLKKKRVDKIFFEIAFNCGNDKNCKSYDEEFDPSENFIVDINYTGYKLNNAEDIPLQITDEFAKKFSFEIGFLDNIYENLFLNWEAVIYKDQKSLFDSLTKRKTEYIYGEIKDSKTIVDPGVTKKDLIFLYDPTGYYYMPLAKVFFQNEHKEYIEYKRIKIQFLDVIANIGALFQQ